MNDMVDMSRFIEAKSDQLNADDLIGRTLDITITRVTGDGGDQPVSIYFEGDGGKPWKPCKTMRRVLMAIWGKYASKDYPGRSCRLYRDDSVTFGGLATGGIRVSHASHIDKEMLVVVMKTKGKKAGIKVLPLPRQAAQEQGQQVDKAAQWAEGFINQLGDGADRLRLMEKNAKTLGRLKTERPELYAKVEAALNAAKIEDDDPFAEGPADEDRGEANAFDADQILGFIQQKVRVSDVNALVASHADTIASFSEEDRARVAEAQAAKIEDIKGAAE